MPPIFLIVGAPATGKSTASRALAARFPKSIAIGVDDLRNMVIGGVVHPSAAWGDELVAQLQLARTSALLMARTYHAAGYAVVIDDFYDPYTQMHEYDELVANEKLMRVLLYPNRQKAHAQNLQRSGPGQVQEYLDEGIKIVYAALDTAAGQLTQDGWTVLDTTHDTVEATAARLARLAHQVEGELC